MPKHDNHETAAQHQVLDPCLLGRPVHLLHIFAAQLRDDLAQAMRLNMNRRYWGGFEVDDVAFTRLEGDEVRSRWLSFAAPAGQIAFSLERKVLLSVLNFRYGSGKADSAATDESTVRVTATEERLAVVLGQQLAATLAGRIELNLPAIEAAGRLDGPPGQQGNHCWAACSTCKVGDVIPVSVGRADVLLDDSRLFTAAVTEHKGKLCLTSFEDAE
jgi:hypothetical protein